MIGVFFQRCMQKKFSHNTIGLASWDLFNAKGGLGRALVQMASSLREERCIVHTLSPDDIQTVDHTYSSHRLWTRNPILYSVYIHFVLRTWIRTNAISKLILPVGPGGLFLLMKPKNCTLTCVCYHTYTQQYSVVPSQWWKRLFVYFENRTLAMSDEILCYSQDTITTLNESYHAENVQLLPQLLHIDQWTLHASQKKQYQCVCVARLEKRKGVEVLLDAWKLVIEQEPQAELIIIGDGILRGVVDQSIQKIGSSIQRIPQLTDQDLRRLIQESAVAICPSYLEGFGLAAVEAMAAGTCVIASDVDGLRSLIGNKTTGILVPAGDSSALSKAILSVLHDTNMQEQLSRNAQKHVRERFNYINARKKFAHTIQKSSYRRTDEKKVTYT